ncbi:MAG TPA: metal ABC transporter substrate-binding protein [Methylomirabilota bacterium]|nr:metal ABC transporter substrate-binding protein [Methylomirabilota bacterium]
MRRLIAVLLVAMLAAAGVQPAAETAARLRVIATIPDLKALTEAVGGDLVEVESLVRGNQNPHDLEVRPSLMVKVRRANALIVNGLELDGWADAVLRGANNPAVIPGAPGFIDASRGVPVIDVPTSRLDRSMGDVHPFGNPHYTLDPGLAPVVTQNILDGLARLAPEQRAAFERQRQAFLARLEPAIARWQAALAPVREARLIVYHSNLGYFFKRFGLTQLGTIEDRPGIPPSPAHLARLVREMKDARARVVVVVEPWSDQRLAARLAEETGAKVAVVNGKLGAASGREAYITSVDANVAALAQAAR